MVDALRAAHRTLRPDGVVIDVRPDLSRDARIVAEGRVRARMPRDVDADHARADEAIARALALGLFVRISSGAFWYESRFRDLAQLDEYLAGGEHPRRDAGGWRAALTAYRSAPLTFRRAARVDVLRRAGRVRSSATARQ